MKKTLFFSAVMLFIGAACTQVNKPGYTINGNLSGITGNVYLTVFEGKMPSRIDSAQVVNGQFMFKGDRKTPILASLQTDNGDLVRFFLENSVIDINGSADSPVTISVTGSKTEDVYKRLQNETNTLKASLPENAAPEVRDSINNLITATKRQFIKNNPSSVVAAYVLYRELSYMMTPEEMDSSMSGFDSTVRSSIYSKLIESMSNALKKTAPGQVYTDISVPDKDGNIIPLSSIADSNKYVLLDFWASWCPPCRAEAPNLVSAYKEFAPKGFEIYAVSLDQNKEEWIKGIQDLKLDWINVSDLTFWESKAAETYGIRSIPSNILIAPDGKIIARNLRGTDLHNKLAEVLAQNK